MRLFLHGTLALLLGLTSLCFFLPSSEACPFCVEQKGPTLVGDYNQALMVLYGHFTNPKLDNSGGLDGGTTDFVIEDVLKSNKIIQGKKIITLPRYVASTKNKFLIFCDVYKGLIDPYRGIEVQPGSDLVKYIKGAITLKDRPLSERLRYCFDFLNSTETEVALDAYREFQKADYADYRNMAKTLPAGTIAAWLQDPKTPAYRYGLYASLLGHCGGEKQAKLLQEMIDNPKVRRTSGIDGLLAGYVMLLQKENKTKEGLDFLRKILDNGKEEFLMRYATLRTLRFFWQTREDVFAKPDIAKAVALTLNHSDMADFGIEDLRKWHQWNMADRILGMFKKEGFDVPVINRAILRFALQCADQTKEKMASDQARLFVRGQETTAEGREWVTETRELLALETNSSKQ